MNRIVRLFALLLTLAAPLTFAQDDTLLQEALDLTARVNNALPSSWEARVEFYLAWAEEADAAGYDAFAASTRQIGLLTAYSLDLRVNIKWLEALYRQTPDQPLLRNALAWDLIDQKGDPEAALALLRGRDARPIYEWDTLAWAQYKAGRKVEAMHTILFAVRLARQKRIHHPVLYDHAGDIFYANGHSIEAVKMWRESERVFLLSDEDPLHLKCSQNYTPAHSVRKRAAVRKLLLK